MCFEFACCTLDIFHNRYTNILHFLNIFYFEFSKLIENAHFFYKLLLKYGRKTFYVCHKTTILAAIPPHKMLTKRKRLVEMHGLPFI